VPYALQSSDLMGVWQRESISVAGGDPYEDSNVLWLYTGDYFADVRWPRLGQPAVATSAFAGRAFWEPPEMHFMHEVDLTKEFTEDVGYLSLLDDQLIEAGQVVVDGEVIQFQEVWSPTIKATRENCLVASRSDDLGVGYIVKVCDYVIAMEETDEQFSAAAWKRDKESWVLQVGSGRIKGLTTLLGSFLSGALAAPWTVNI
jgi:hypothetical protein